jgi:chromosome segregation ATPase
LRETRENSDNRLRLERENSTIRIEKVSVERQLESANAKELDLTRRLTGSENENNRLLIRLDERVANYNQRIENLNNQLTTLRLESGEKESKIREQTEEIKLLKEKLGTTQREARDEKLQFKQEKLETLATQLGIQLRRIENLRRRFKELIIAQ